MLTLRAIDPNDYTVHEDGHIIGRIRQTRWPGDAAGGWARLPKA